MDETVQAAIERGKEKFGKGKHVDALMQFQQAKSLAEQRGLDYEQAQAYSWLGNGYHANKDNEKALDAYSKGMLLAEQFDDQLLIHRFHINLGNTLADVQRYAESKVHLNTAIRHFQSDGDSFHLLLGINGMGMSMLHNLELDSAQLFLESSLELADQIGDEARYARICADLGSLYFTRGEYDISRGQYEKALDLLKRLGEIYATRQLYFDLMEVNFYSDATDTAIIWLDRYDSVFDDVLPEHQKKYDKFDRLRQKERIVVICILIAIGLLLLATTLWYSKKLRRLKQINRPETNESHTTTMRNARIVEALASLVSNPGYLWTYFYAVKGMKNTEIADELNVTRQAIGGHLTRIREKLGLKDSKAMMKHAKEIGVSSLTEEEFRDLFKLR